MSGTELRRARRAGDGGASTAAASFVLEAGAAGTGGTAGGRVVGGGLWVVGGGLWVVGAGRLGLRLRLMGIGREGGGLSGFGHSHGLVVGFRFRQGVYNPLLPGRFDALGEAPAL